MTTHPEVSTSTHPAVLVEDDKVTSLAGRRLLAVTRIATGFIFLWAFLDKTFGLHYSTGAPVAEGDPTLSWLNGGKPSQGFLTYAAQGPFKGFFNSISGTASDWLFMLGMLGIGVAVMLGIGMRIAAVSGALMMAMMWLAEWPLIQGSTNPIVDYHVIYALTLITGAILLTGDTWGLGRWWAKLPIVRRWGWLR